MSVSLRNHRTLTHGTLFRRTSFFRDSISTQLYNMATLQQQFINSCTLGEVFKIEKMIQKGEADVNKPDSKGFTPLHLTLGSNQQEVAEMLIKLGANVNSTTSKDSFTPLHVAASQGLTDIIPILIKAGANIDKKDANGNTALCLACDSLEPNASNAALLLIQVGADIKILNNAKRNAALLAAKNGKQQVFQTLYERGADIAAKDNMGTCAEDYAKNW